MDPLRLDLDPTVAPADHLRALLAGLPGDWRVDGAGDTWRAEQSGGGLVRSVGMTRTPTGWLLSWRVDPEVSDGPALAVIGTALVAAVLVLALAGSAGYGAVGLVASAGTMLGVIEVGRGLVRSRLPDAAPATVELGEKLRALARTATSQRDLHRDPIGTVER